MRIKLGINPFTPTVQLLLSLTASSMKLPRGSPPQVRPFPKCYNHLGNFLISMMNPPNTLLEIKCITKNHPVSKAQCLLMISSSKEKRTFCKYLEKDLGIIQHNSGTKLNFIALNFSCVSTCFHQEHDKKGLCSILQDVVSTTNNSVESKALF